MLIYYAGSHALRIFSLQIVRDLRILSKLLTSKNIIYITDATYTIINCLITYYHIESLKNCNFKLPHLQNCTF